MRLNKKGTKVLLDNKVKAFGVLGFAIQVGIPLWYVAWKYNIFTFENARYAITGWGMIFFAMIAFFMRGKIKMWVDNYNTLGVTASRAKWGHVFLTVFIILAISSFFINAFLWFFGILTFSNYMSLIAYAPYDVQVQKQKELQEELKKETTHETLDQLKSQRLLKLNKSNTRQAII